MLIPEPKMVLDFSDFMATFAFGFISAYLWGIPFLHSYYLRGRITRAEKRYPERPRSDLFWAIVEPWDVGFLVIFFLLGLPHFLLFTLCFLSTIAKVLLLYLS